MTRLLSQSLIVAEDRDGAMVGCRACHHALVRAQDAWKPHAVMRERRFHDIDPIYTTDGALLLREFFCPGCGALLDTEVALPGDPFLDDRLVV